MTIVQARSVGHPRQAKPLHSPQEHLPTGLGCHLPLSAKQLATTRIFLPCPQGCCALWKLVFIERWTICVCLGQDVVEIDNEHQV
jgi:hypothetical protein